MRKHALVALLMFGWMLPAIPAALSVNLRTGEPHETPFEIHTNVRVATAPVKLRVEARYDIDNVLGTLCIVVDGSEFHDSCWDADGSGPRLKPVDILLEHGGEYIVQMVQVSGNGKRQSNAIQFVLQ